MSYYDGFYRFDYSDEIMENRFWLLYRTEINNNYHLELFISKLSTGDQTGN